MADPTTAPVVAIVPGNEASWEDLQLVYGTRGAAACAGFRRRVVMRTDFGEAKRRGNT